jgi:hypothetical protein
MTLAKEPGEVTVVARGLDDHVIVDIPRRTRIWKAATTLVVTLGLSGWAFGYVLIQDQVAWETLWLLPFLFTGLWLTWRFWKTTYVTELTLEAQERKEAVERETLQKAAEFEERWYVRYPIALLILWGAWYIFEKKPNAWWVAAIAAFAALYYARELALFALSIGLLYALFQGIAALPVSVAIIIGAIIIASALKR